FSGSDLMDVLHKVVSAAAPPIERFAPHVSPLVGAVLNRGLEKDPAARYPTVLDFASAFSAACENALPMPAGEALGSARTVPASGPTSPAPPMQLAPAAVFIAERLQTGAQRRTASSRFANASTMAGSANLQDIPESLERARQALGLGDLNLAVAYAESAIRLAEGFDSSEARFLVDAESMLIDHIFETRIGSLQQRLTVVSVPSNLNSRVSPEQAFLLSRLDGGASVEEVLDLSPLSRRDTLRQLLSLMRDGLIAFGEGRTSDKLKPE
ncbi:MAG TPA: hypothetical protein VJV79_26815, partial [Polyangiaceae bacterium]|nr:hypothetical protein [Polyangiaceae bacterium]